MDAWSTPSGCEIHDVDITAGLAHAPGTVDLVLTHDCPTGIGVCNTPGLEHYGQPGVAGLARLAAHLRPRLWFFGHHHRWHAHEEDGVRYVGLPESWLGYALLLADGTVERVENEVARTTSPRWFRFFGLR
jgi:Icc-related predicted phosphoesterase